MKRYILTGTSGSGKTSSIRELKGKGYPNVNQYRNEEFIGWRWYRLGCLLRQSQWGNTGKPYAVSELHDRIAITKMLGSCC